MYVRFGSQECCIKGFKGGKEKENQKKDVFGGTGGTKAYAFCCSVKYMLNSGKVSVIGGKEFLKFSFISILPFQVAFCMRVCGLCNVWYFRAIWLTIFYIHSLESNELCALSLILSLFYSKLWLYS